MTQDKKKNPLAQKTAEQVKNLLSKRNAYVFYTLTSQLPPHHYDLVQIPKIPSQSRRLPLYGTQMKTPSKKQRAWDSKKRGERGVAVALKDNARASKELHPNRVKLCKLKEHHLASRRLKSISTQKKMENSIKGRTIDSFDEVSPEYVKDERMEYWESLIQSREERHFNIGRVIKYLST